MGNADSVSAVFGLLLGLVAHHPPVLATANAATSGPAVAIEKAQTAATAESSRARESDAEAARVFSPTSDAAPVANATKPSTATAATAAEASKATAPADASAATVPAEASDAVIPADASKTAASTAADAQLAANGSEDTYDPSRHRDPFRPPPNVTPDKAIVRTPLEGYELGKLGFQSPEELHYVFEAMRRAYAARNAKIDAMWERRLKRSNRNSSNALCE